MHLALKNLFQAKWTNEIHDEWISNLLNKRPDLERETLERTRDLMNRSLLDCIVDDYSNLIPSLTLPDDNDRHVLAAAIDANADFIITFNLRDFPDDSLTQYGIAAVHPDEFVVDLLMQKQSVVCAAVKAQRENLRNPPQSVRKLLDTFNKCQLPMTAEALLKYENSL